MSNPNLDLDIDQLEIADALWQGYVALGRWEAANVREAYSSRGQPSAVTLAVRRASTVRAGAHAMSSGLFAALSLASAHGDPVAKWVLDRALDRQED